jgi:hypothetical protein
MREIFSRIDQQDVFHQSSSQDVRLSDCQIGSRGKPLDEATRQRDRFTRRIFARIVSARHHNTSVPQGNRTIGNH